MQSMGVGPLLRRYLDAQQTERAVLSSDSIGVYAGRIAEVCRLAPASLLWPVGPAAERLAGATQVLSCEPIQVWDHHTAVDGREVLVLLVADVTGLNLSAAINQARSLGATHVRACGVDVVGIDQCEGLAGFEELSISCALATPA